MSYIYWIYRNELRKIVHFFFGKPVKSLIAKFSTSANMIAAIGNLA